MSLHLLQVPTQDGSELLIPLIIGVIVTALSVYFVYNDATKRNNEKATQWTPGRNEISSDDRTWGVIAHAAAFAGFVVPLGNVLGPLLVWAIKKDESPFAAENGRRAVNFQSTWVILTLSGITVLWVASRAGLWATPPFFIYLAVTWIFLPLILTVVAIIRVSDGKVYDYPVAFDLVS